MAKKIGTAGNRGPSVRSDCYIQLKLNESGGNIIDLKSKVGDLYGESIKELCLQVLEFYEIENAIIEIEDKGALPFVLTARMEAAIKQVKETNKEYLLPELLENNISTPKEINRRSRLYLPGNDPKLMVNAGLHGADGIILDLEDAVAFDKKEEARILTRNALRQVDFYGAERMVRINQIPRGLDDLTFIVPHGVNLILIPKCETPEQVMQVETEIARLKTVKNRQIHLMPIIESALGIINAYKIAKASESVVALAIGLEDYTADIGAQRTNEAKESFFARSAIVNACRAAGIQPIDSVFSDVADMEALKKNVLESKSMGFAGMGCIHPRQVQVVNDNFDPSEKEIVKAQKIVDAFFKAEEQGLGVVSVGTKMVDPPVVKRALKVIDDAITARKLEKNWRDNYEG